MLYKQVVFLAGAKPAELLIDELVVVSSAAPPRGLASTARPPRDAAGSPGWCEYLSSEFDRVGRHAARSGNGEAQGGGGGNTHGGGGGSTHGGGARRGGTRGSGVGGVRARGGGARSGDARSGGLRPTRRGRGRGWGRRMLGSSMARSRAAGGSGARRGDGDGAGRAQVGRALAAVPPIALPVCRVLDGDHLQGRWVQHYVEDKPAQTSASRLSGGLWQSHSMPQAAPSSSVSPRPTISCLVRVGRPYRAYFRQVQNCDPQSISRPDRYAYGRTLPGSPGNWDYRQCFKMSYEERERSRAALSWSWQPVGCQLRRVDGAAFSAWLGQRTLLLWGDSLTGQQFYSLVFMLGDAVTSLLDYSHDAAHERQAESRRDSACGASGFGGEGGALSVARLRGGGRIVKVLGHTSYAATLTRVLWLHSPWLHLLWLH